MNKWWGYLHTDGSLQVKRYFGPENIMEALGSPFVDAVAGPWECNGKEAAIEKLKKVLKEL